MVVCLVWRRHFISKYYGAESHAATNPHITAVMRPIRIDFQGMFTPAIIQAYDSRWITTWHRHAGRYTVQIWRTICPVHKQEQATHRNLAEELLMDSFKYTNKMQHYTIFFITVNALHVSGGFSAHHQELKTVHTASGICQSLLAATASGSSKQAWHIPDAVCTVLSSWWWAEKPPETCRALTVIKNIVYHCILLVILKRIN